MRIFALIAVVFIVALANFQTTAATTCAADNKTRVLANGECLIIKVYGEPAVRTSLVVFIHGDGTSGKPSDYMYEVAQRFASKGVVTVGLIRPGYHDSEGAKSSGSSYRFQEDGYREEIIETVSAAVRELKRYYRAGYVVLAGRSGGSAISGIIIGKYPGLVDAVVLGACLSDVRAYGTN